MRKILFLRKQWKEGLHSKGNIVMNAKGGGRGGGEEDPKVWMQMTDVVFVYQEK